LTSIKLELTAEDLADPISVLLGYRPVATVEWRARPLTHHIRNPVTAGLFLVEGESQRSHDGAPEPWAAVLKILRRPDDAPDWLRDHGRPSHWNYWRREAEAYRSGLLARLPGSLTTAKLLSTTSVDERTERLWIEYVRGDPAIDWRPERYPVAAQQVGQMQGAYLADLPLPSYPWLAQGWLDAWTPTLGPKSLALLNEERDVPLLREVLPDNAAELTRRLHTDRQALRTALERLPRTLCHHDFWPPNLLAVGGRTIALDWSWVGPGACGHDAANLVLDSVAAGYLPADRLRNVEEAVFEAYLDGLRQGAWVGDPRLVLASYSTVAALRFGLDLPSLLRLARDDRRQEALEREQGRPVTEIIAARAAVILRALEHAQRARELLGLLV
jgi:hypothetical protein